MKKVAGTKVRCDHLPLAKEPAVCSAFGFMMLEMYFPGAGKKVLPKFSNRRVLGHGSHSSATKSKVDRYYRSERADDPFFSSKGKGQVKSK